MKNKAAKSPITLKKALLTTLVVVVPGGALLGLAYVLAKKHKTRKP